MIDQYIMRGGRVLWLLDGVQMSDNMLSEGGATPLIGLDVNLQDQLFRYGVRLTPTVVEDMQCAYMPINVARPGEEPRFEPIPWFYMPLLQGSPYHPITKTLQAVKADFASGIEIVGDTVGVRKEVLLITSNASHVHVAPTEIDVMNAINVEPSEYFNTRYVPVAVALEGEFESIYKHRMAPKGVVVDKIVDKSQPTRMVVVADGDVIRNDVEQTREGLMLVPLGYDRVTRQTHGNKDFIVNSLLLSIISDLPGTLTSQRAVFIISVSMPNCLTTHIAAKELYTLNLPGIPTFILSFLSPIFTLKSTYEFVIVISFANTSPALSIPYEVMSLSSNLSGILFPYKSSIFTNVFLDISSIFNFDSK